MKGIIYKITNIINGKSYIGKTILSLDKRFVQHKHDSNKDECKNRPLYRAFKKYGLDAFAIEKLGEFDEEILDIKEIEFIQIYNTYHGGYNATLGGEGKRYINFSDEEVIKKYQECNYVNLTAEYFNCCVDTIRNILNANNIIITKHFQNNTPEQFKQQEVYLVDMNMYFKSVSDAAKWIFENDLSNSLNIECIRRGISRALNGERLSYLKMKWEKI